MQMPGPGILRTDPALRWKDEFVTFAEVERGGTFNFEAFYVFMHQWFQKEAFKHWQAGDNRIEDFYLQRDRADGVMENLIWWRAYKPINPYICYFCKLDWQNFGAKQTETMYRGKKVRAHKMGLTLRIWWWVQIDPENRWEKSILKPWKYWFYNYLLSTEVENHVDKVRRIALQQENEIKQWFEMSTTESMPRSYFPEMGHKYPKVEETEEYFKHAERKGDEPIT